MNLLDNGNKVWYLLTYKGNLNDIDDRRIKAIKEELERIKKRILLNRKFKVKEVDADFYPNNSFDKIIINTILT